MARTTGRAALCVAALLLGGGAAVISAPVSGAVCGSIGGPRIDVSGCADPLYEMNYLPPAPPPPPAYLPPPPPPPVYAPPPPVLPNVNVCANVGRRISVSGCI